MTMLNLVRVPGGTFQRDEKTGNTSTVRAFRMSEKPVTREIFRAIMGTDPSNTANSTGMNDPVQMTNWYHAISFCNKLSLAEGMEEVYSIPGVNFAALTFEEIPTKNNPMWDAVIETWINTGYRLPTEMEWMWASSGALSEKAGYKKAFAGSNGGNSIEDYAWIDRNSSRTTHPVGTKLPNELGLYDMSGNVWEWIWDWHGKYPEGAVENYRGAVSGVTRVMRGGSWSGGPPGCSVSYRGRGNPGYQYCYDGFRVVCL